MEREFEAFFVGAHGALPTSVRKRFVFSMRSFVMSERILSLLLVACLGVCLATPVAASVIVTENPLTCTSNMYYTDNAGIMSQWNTAYSANPVNAGTDVLKNHVTSVTYSGTISFSSKLADINDGMMVSNNLVDGVTGKYAAGDTNNDAAFSNGGDLVFNLDNKYNLSEIDSFTVFDPTRLGQKYDLYASTDGGTTWGPAITPVNYTNAVTDNYCHVREISLTDASGTLAAGVNALKFHMSDPSGPGSNNYTAVFGEIAAYGAVASPEPSAILLLVTGALGLLAYAWRKRK